MRILYAFFVEKVEKSERFLLFAQKVVTLQVLFGHASPGYLSDVRWQNKEIMTAEELDKIWEEAMAKQKKDIEAWESLSEEEKNAIHDEIDEGFYARITDNPFGNDD